MLRKNKVPVEEGGWGSGEAGEEIGSREQGTGTGDRPFLMTQSTIHNPQSFQGGWPCPELVEGWMGGY